MRHVQADLWERWERGEKVVVTTNVGWCPRTRRNNMGAGMALQAARRWPWLPRWYGSFCRDWVTHHASRWRSRWAPVVELDLERIILLPVKPLLDFADPERSWEQKARLDLIQAGLRQLAQHQGQIALAFPGCGNGGLSPEDVLPALRATLTEERFTLCDWEFPVDELQRRVGITSAVDGLAMLDEALAGAGLKVRKGKLVRG